MVRIANMNTELCRFFFEPYQNGRLFVGFSGGADSTATLLTVLMFREQFNYEVTAVHFNHHLRGQESDADAAFCKAFAQQHNVDFKQIDLHIPQGRGLENAARAERLKHWQQLADPALFPCPVAVVLGHHANDRAENFFLRCLRGGNLSALLSPRSCAKIGSITILRPLLEFSLSEIETFLQKNDILCWRNDSTNQIADCSRNKLRLEILPALFSLFPGAEKGLFSSLRVLEKDADFVESQAALMFDPERVNSISYWKSLHPALAVRIFRRWTGIIPDSDLLERFMQEINKVPAAEPRKLPLKENICLIFQDDTVDIMQPVPLPSDIAIDKTSGTISGTSWGNWLLSADLTDNIAVSSEYEAVFDLDQLPDQLILSAAEPGDEIRIFGSGAVRKIKKLRVDRKIHAYPPLPLLKDKDDLVYWAPGIRHSCHAPATARSRKIIRFILNENQ